jgi:hypothetical protein
MKYLLIFLAACQVPTDRTEVGPEIHISMSQGFESVNDESDPATLSLEGATAYTIDMIAISSSSGTDEQFGEYPVTSYNASITIPTTTIPDPGFTSDNQSDPTFTRNGNISLPASAAGQKLKVHVDAVDSRGLSANVIDFSIALTN